MSTVEQKLRYLISCDAERLSDKVQIMMVPADGKFFFANDVLRAAPTAMATATRPVRTEDALEDEAQ